MSVTGRDSNFCVLSHGTLVGATTMRRTTLRAKNATHPQLLSTLYYSALNCMLCNLVYFFKRHIPLQRDAPAFLVLWSGADYTRPQALDLHQHRTEQSLNRLLRALRFEPLHLLYAHAQRAAFTQQEQRQCLGLFWWADDGHQRGRAILLHLQRRVADIQRPGRQQAFHQPAQQFTAHVVNVTLYDGHPVDIGFLVSANGCLSQAEAQAVGPGELFLSKAIAYTLNSDCRGLKTRQGREDSSPCGI